MRKSIDSVGPRPEKKNAEPLVTHKAGEVFRPRGAAPKAGESVKPKGYVDPKTQEVKPHTLTETEHKSAQQHRKKPGKKTLIIAAGVLVALVVLFAASVPVVNYLQQSWKKQNDKKYINLACTRDNVTLLNDAIASINSQDMEVLQAKAVKIRALDRYDLDQNCLAVISWQQMTSGDFSGARDSISRINSFYDASQEKGVDGVIYTGNPQKLSKFADNFEKAAAQTKKNSDAFSNPRPRQ